MVLPYAALIWGSCTAGACTAADLATERQVCVHVLCRSTPTKCLTWRAVFQILSKISDNTVIQWRTTIGSNVMGASLPMPPLDFSQRLSSCWGSHFQCAQTWLSMCWEISSYYCSSDRFIFNNSYLVIISDLRHMFKPSELMSKHLEIKKCTPTAPRTRQPSASSPITPLASTSSRTSSNTTAKLCCGKVVKTQETFFFIILASATSEQLRTSVQTADVRMKSFPTFCVFAGL